MRKVVFLDGPNFSGRSQHIHKWLLEGRSKGCSAVFLGPSIASVLTGLATTVAGELDLYIGWNAVAPPPLQAYFAPKSKQILSSLSGGEQVLLALAGISRPNVRIGIDCALEQLDNVWKTWTTTYLCDGLGDGVVQLADNQTSLGEPDCEVVRMSSRSSEFRIQLDTAMQSRRSGGENATLVVEGLSFRYPRGPLVFHDCFFHLTAGTVYRLRGPNGSGKSTLIRLLCGVLPFHSGSMFLNGRLYEPYREGNRVIALSMQNPDDQWTDVSVAGDFAQRLRYATFVTKDSIPSPNGLLTKWESMLGLTGRLHQHVLDFPRVLRKRLSWVWPLSGYLPWLVFDEPTLGQDDATVTQFAEALSGYAAQGYGVIYIAHDDRLPRLVRSTELILENGKVVHADSNCANREYTCEM